jgi:hypothetical protein
MEPDVLGVCETCDCYVARLRPENHLQGGLSNETKSVPCPAPDSCSGQVA